MVENLFDSFNTQIIWNLFNIRNETKIEFFENQNQLKFLTKDFSLQADILYKDQYFSLERLIRTRILYK